MQIGKIRDKASIGRVVIDEIANFIKESYPNGESGIVYCFSRKECEQVASELREHGISADYYHADMDVNAREKVHMRWSKNKLQVIVGTVAFGMGINKPDVRFVIHHSLSKSMETYYQESGRAGRDGLPSECLLFFRPADVHRQSAMVFYENAGLQNLYDIVRYCLTKKQCRRSAIFQHFAEPGRDCNGMCDNCAFSCEVTEMDLSGHAKLVVSVVRNMQENEQRATMLQLVDKIKNKQKELGSEQKRATLEQLVLQLILDRVLKEEFQHTAYATNAYVTLGPLAKQVLQGKKTIRLEVASQQNMDSCRKKTKRGLASSLEYKLDKLRKELCLIDGGVFPHSILSTQQISLISSIKPKTWEELEKIIGKLKTEKYGNRILEEVKRDANLEQATNEMLDEEEKVNKHRKKMKTKNDVVLVESSDDDA